MTPETVRDNTVTIPTASFGTPAVVPVPVVASASHRDGIDCRHRAWEIAGRSDPGRRAEPCSPESPSADER